MRAEACFPPLGQGRLPLTEFFVLLMYYFAPILCPKTCFFVSGYSLMSNLKKEHNRI